MEAYKKWEIEHNPHCSDEERHCDDEDNLDCDACERRVGWRAALKYAISTCGVTEFGYPIQAIQRSVIEKELEVTSSET